MCTEWSARAFISMEVAGFEAMWLPWIPQQQYGHLQEKAQIKTDSQISHSVFHQEPHDESHRFIKSPRLGVR